MDRSHGDVTAYYARHFRTGMHDLSDSAAPTLKICAELAASECRQLRYTPEGGPPELRAAIAARYAGLHADDVLVTGGASEALAALALATIQPGTHATIVEGVYPSFTRVAAALGGRVRWSPHLCPRCATLVICNPTVPEGRWRDVRSTIAAGRLAGATVVVDEVYRELALGGTKHPAACEIDTRAVSVGDLSKPLGLGGLRIGWITTRDKALLDRVRAELRNLSAGPASVSTAVAMRAMDAFDAHISDVAARLLATAPRVCAVLDRHGWTYTPPDAGVAVVASPRVEVTEAALGRLRGHGLFLLPCRTFGERRGFRVNLLQDAQVLDQALTALAATAISRGSRELVVLSKAPSPGFAKTRLAASVGACNAAAVARAMLEDTLALAARGGWATTVAYAGEAAALPATRPGMRLELQADGDLGTRIHHALRSALSRAAGAVLIGSDTPDLPLRIVESAFAALWSCDVVVGPATDGGFYLLGLRRPEARLFDGVAWSTTQTLVGLLANARRLGLRVQQLEEWTDVDDMPSLEALRLRLASESCAPGTRQALERVGTERAHVT